MLVLKYVMYEIVLFKFYVIIIIVLEIFEWFVCIIIVCSIKVF